MTTTKPIIIFGTGRSGTTVFHQMLSEHPNLAWMSRLCDVFPDTLAANKLLMKSLETPLFPKSIAKKVKTSEGYVFWEQHAKGFSEPFRDLLATDLSVKTKKDILNVMSKMTTKKRNRLLIKITGWPRIGYLSEVFEDAKFIHVIRDGRAVANSLVSVDFWSGWEGPDKWRWGPLSKAYEDEWNEYDQSFIALAGIQWKILMDATEKAKASVDKSRILEVRYEDLCEAPVPVLRDVARFCEVEWNDYFEARLDTYKLRNTNSKYEQELNLQQQEILNNVLAGYLRKFGYLEPKQDVVSKTNTAVYSLGLTI